MRRVPVIALCCTAGLCASIVFGAQERFWQLLLAGKREEARELAAAKLSGSRSQHESGEALLVMALSEPDGSKACTLLNQFLSDFPGHSLSWLAEMSLGHCSYSAGTYRQAAKYFERVLGRKPPPGEETKARYWVGLSLAAAGDLEKAKEEFASVIAGGGQGGVTDAALLGLADCLRQEGKYQAALTEYTRLTSKYGRGDWVPCALHGAGVCLEKMHRQEEARRLYSRLVTEFPSSFEAALVKDKVKGTAEAKAAPQARGTYSVQVGAFSQEANAAGLAARLRERGVTGVTVAEADRGGRTLYVVLFGDFPTKEAAVGKGNELAARFGLSYSIVSR
ncbi:MAG: tetratricopeptide repeat protein [Candidatus Eisenbacteria bacterium]